MNKDKIKEKLDIVTDFIERWNKQDKEVEVANAIQELPTLIQESNKEAVEYTCPACGKKVVFEVPTIIC